MAESDRQLALRALRDALTSGDAKPAERVRAAEALLRAEADNLAETADFLAATDAELLAIARGEEGGTPPERGPGDSSSAAVPSHAIQVPTPLLASSNPFMKKAIGGPKTDPAKGDPPPAISGQFDHDGQNGHDPDPWT